MDLIKPSIPWSFIRPRCKLTWREILFGLDNELLAPDAPREVAIDEMGEDPPPAWMALAISEPSDLSHVQQLAEAEPPQLEEAIRDKWLFLVLAWFLENPPAEDRLGIVEMVYADFGYPEDIEGFVRYMPADAPDLGSRERNEGRLFDRWKAFVDERTARYAHSPPSEHSADNITPPAPPARGAA